MSGLRELKRRMKAVKSTAQVTRAMQLVAASKMKRAQQMAITSRPYAELLAQFFATIPPETLATHPLLEKRTVKRRGILVITPDKGLCGSLNTNLLRELLKLPKDATYVAIGRRATQFIARLQRPLLAEFPLSDRARFSEVKPAFEFLLKAYAEGQVDTVEILYTEFINAMKQQPTLEALLPIDNIQTVLAAFPKHALAAAPIANDARPFIIEPDAQTILNALIPLYIKQELYHAALEAKASEHSARMVAMKSATDNAKQLVSDLTLIYNKARQGAITQEISEIASAAAATANN